jgi:hypothetical protein
MNMETLETELADSFPNLEEIVNSIEMLPHQVITNTISKSLPNPEEMVKTLDLPNPEVANILGTLPDPEEISNSIAEFLPNPEEFVKTLDLPNQEVANILDILPDPEEISNSIAEFLPNPEEMVNTLLAESLLNSPKVENVDSLINCLEVITTIESLINSPKVENVESLPIPSFSQISRFKRPQLRIQLPTFNTNNTVLTELVLSPLKENTKEQKEQKDKEQKEQKDKNQDRAQKMAVFSTLLMELYRMLTSSLLILFVPQSCKGQLCSISDNLTWNPKNHKYNFGLCVNFITLFIYTCLYYVELKRENRLIKYLDVNPDMPSSNEAVENTLQNIAEEKKKKILAIDKYYQRISYLSIGMYVFNSIVSGVIISKYYFGTQTTTSFITSVLFMFTKLLNVYQVSNTEEHIFYSGYMKTFVQFNDLDKSHKNPDNL